MGGFFEFLSSNIWHVLPILVAGGFAVAISAERLRALFSVYPIKNSEEFFDKLSELVMAGRLGEAINVCDKYPAKPAAQVAKQALLRAHQPESLIENGVELAVGSATQSISKRTSFLATIANVATLLGLFGTIAGLIQSFQAVGHADPQQKSELLAAGISTAMNATMMGLAVAIPCMVMFSFLINRTNRLIADVDHSAVRTIDLLKQRYYAAETEALNPRNTNSKLDEQEDDDADDEAVAKIHELRRTG
jgi:biopolymer transport protein ExbB/TolQ